MKFVIFAALVTVALTSPVYDASSPSRAASHEDIEVLKDDRHHDENRKYNFEFESENSISWSERRFSWTILFVLDQIAFAAEEDRHRALEGSPERLSVRNPPGTYRAPQ
ncbi:hypothetical protein SK128_025100 [Halocaridina rubra]|uniref:Uncharacterized protein n=1 Tax=Halocaridina rubra TaxID=373956 RepID=A0AAN8WXT9_HALRR